MIYPSQEDMPTTAPEQAMWHAELIVPAMKENENVTLDYSPESLKHLDKLLHSFHKSGLTVERMPKTLFQIGCYLGQVVVNACPGSKWMHPKDIDSSLPMSDLVILFPDNVVWAPTSSAVRALQEPGNNSLFTSCSNAIRIYGRQDVNA